MKRSSEVQMDIEEIRNMIWALEAMAGDSGIAGILKILSMTLPEECSAAWASVYQILGGKYAGLCRFDIVHGVLQALRECETRVWAKVWLAAISAANIHPASLILCADPRCSDTFQPLYEIFREANAKNHWFRVARLDAFLDTLTDRFWQLQLRHHRAIHNLISSKPVYLLSPEGRCDIQIGNGWAVHSLTVNGNPRGVDMKVIIHSDLTVLGNLDFALRGKVFDIWPRLKVGGIFHPPGLNREFDAAFCRCKVQQGVRVNGQDIIYGVDGIHWPKEPFLDPILAPMSFQELYSGNRPDW